MDKDKGLAHYLKSFSVRDEAAEKCVSLMQPDVSGGRITYDQIDTLKRCPYAVEIWASGLTQETFDYLIDHYGQQFKVIHFWKYPLINDLTRIEKLTKLEYVLFFWDQRATHLWDLSKNISLKGISISDFTRMHTLEEIPLASRLEKLYFGDKVWDKYIFSAKKIEEKDIN